MCDIAMGLGLVSTLVGTAGTIQQANAQAKAAKYNAKVDDMNAKLATRRAQDAIERGQLEEQQKRKEVAQVKGQQLAAMAANGVDTGFGSPLDVLVDTATMGELDALTVRSNAAREAYAHDTDAVNKRASAELNRMEAKSAKQGGYLSALGTLIGGVGDAWGSFKKSRVGSYA